MTKAVALKFRTLAWGTPQNPPTRFALFHFGRNETTKGSVYLSRAGAERCVAKWKARRIELAADFEHAALSPGTEGAPASAWFDLEVGEDGLYATNVRWSQRAKDYFTRGEYRYHSPFVDLETDAQGKDWVVGLTNFALTNWPATNRQRPLVARAFTAGRRFTMLDPAKLKEVLEALEKTSLAPEEVSALISACTGAAAAPAEAPLEEPMAAPEEEKKDEELMPYAAPAVDVVAASAPAQPSVSLRAAFGLKADASDAEVAAVAAVTAKQYAALGRQVKILLEDKTKRDAEERQALFSEFKGKGKLRFAKESEAKALLDTHGAAAFKAAFAHVPDLAQTAPAQTAALPTTGVGAAIEAKTFAGRPTNLEVVNTEKAIPVAELQAYMDKHNVGPAKAARALRAIGGK